MSTVLYELGDFRFGTFDAALQLRPQASSSSARSFVRRNRRDEQEVLLPRYEEAVDVRTNEHEEAESTLNGERYSDDVTCTSNSFACGSGIQDQQLSYTDHEQHQSAIENCVSTSTHVVSSATSGRKQYGWITQVTAVCLSVFLAGMLSLCTATAYVDVEKVHFMCNLEVVKTLCNVHPVISWDSAFRVQSGR